MDALKKHSITIAGHRTSITLEDVFWTALKDIATAKGMSLSALIEEVDEARGGNLSSALRTFAMEETIKIKYPHT